MNLGQLRHNADTTASARGHALQWDAPQHGESGSTQRGACPCGQEAHIGTTRNGPERELRDVVSFPDQAGEPRNHPLWYCRRPLEEAPAC